MSKFISEYLASNTEDNLVGTDTNATSWSYDETKNQYYLQFGDLETVEAVYDDAKNFISIA